jgi:hypothetical protein
VPYKDPEKHKQWRKAYYAAHKEKASKDAVDWYHAHKTEPGVLATRRAHSYRWKETHHEQHLAARRRRSTGKTRVAQEAKWGPTLARALAAGCTLCHEGDAKQLRFRHVARRSFKIAYPHLWESRKKEVVEAEIRKCMVVCADCDSLIEKGLAALPNVPLDAYWARRLF